MDTLAKTILAILVAAIPFELNFLPVASSLQWLFLVLSVISFPILWRERQRLFHDRLIVAAIMFVGTQWLSVAVVPEFRSNAVLGSIRVTMGFALLCITLCFGEQKTLMRVWTYTALAAAVYALLDHFGAGIPKLFRPGEFHVGTVERLSGSFEYPNTAAAYFSLSLPIVWTTLSNRWIRIAGAVLLLIDLILTYSRGAMIALLLMLIVWALISKSRSMFIFAGLGFATLATVALFEPFVIQRFANEPAQKPFDADVQPEFNRMRLPPGGMYDVELRVTNKGTKAWETSSTLPFTVSYRWYDPKERILVYKSFDFIRIPTPVRPEETVTMRVPFQVIQQTGIHLMTWDVSQNDKNRFRDRAVFPGLIEVDVEPSTEPWFGRGDLGFWFHSDNFRIFVPSIPFGRSELWQAALGMIRKHPILGVGPDNFRLLYGRYFGTYSWDTRIRSNNLYLELLTGSGFVGFVSFIVMMLALKRNVIVPAIALGIFMIHGVVDVFLMTTPIYFSFWILLGLAHDRGRKATSIESMYDRASIQYDANVDGIEANARLRQRFQQLVLANVGEHATILDFGCGTGTDAACYAAHGHRVIAYDISSGMIDQLRVRCAPEIESGRVVPVTGEFVALREALLRSGRVDAVASNFAVLNHLRDLRPFFRELAVHLPTEGVLLAAVLNPFHRFDMKSRWWWKGLLQSPWTGSIKMTGNITTYRHFIRNIRRMAKPHFAVVDRRSSVPDDPMGSNFLILTLRKSR